MKLANCRGRNPVSSIQDPESSEVISVLEFLSSIFILLFHALLHLPAAGNQRGRAQAGGDGGIAEGV